MTTDTVTKDDIRELQKQIEELNKRISREHHLLDPYLSSTDEVITHIPEGDYVSSTDLITQGVYRD